MAIKKLYLNQKYNTLYFPFQTNGSESSSQSISSVDNFGGNKKIEIGGGKTSLSDEETMLYYGLYCRARSLVGFDTNDLDVATSSSLSAIMRIYHIPSTDFVPDTMNIEVYPLTADWSAGTYTEYPPTKGYSNWWNRTSTEEWSGSGGLSVDASLSSVISLSPSNEDIEHDVTNVLRHSLSTGIRYYGFLLKLSDDIESVTSTVVFKKSMYAGDFSLPHKLPRIDIQYNDYIADDRFSFIAGQTNRIYFYNNINGSPMNINFTTASANIQNENNVVVASGNVIEDPDRDGYYYSDLNVPLSSFKEHMKYTDNWTFNMSDNITTLTRKNNINVINPLDDSYDIKNSRKLKLSLNKSVSHRNDDFILSLEENKFYFYKSWAKSSKPEKYVPSECYYRIYSILDKSNYKEKYYFSDWDRMSTQENGLTFSIDKTIFPIGKYFIEFKIVIFGNTYYYTNEKYFFEVQEDFLS